MNANELASAMDSHANQWKGRPEFRQAATTLRQQQAEIAELKVMLGHYEDVYEGVVTHPVKELTDEEIYRLLADSIWAVGLNTDCLDEQNWADGITVARAILRKAQEK